VKYIYKAKDGPVNTIEGVLDADSRSDAVALVDGMGYSPIWVKEKPLESTLGSAVRARRISTRDVTVFTRQLASLTKSGVPILKSLHTIALQTENVRFGPVIEDLERTIRDGSMLSNALARYPKLFSELYINMVRSGESGGVLDTILLSLSDAREAEEDFRRKVQAAIAYPTLIVTVGAITVFVLLAFFMPRVVALFDDDVSRLPLPTQILIGISDFFHQNWYWIAMVACLAIAVFQRLASLDRGRTFVDRIKLNIPLLRGFIIQSDIARFARTLSLLVSSGIPIDKGLELSASTLQNHVLREEVEAVRMGTVQHGRTVSEGLTRAAHFPIFVANMTAVGEEAGRLDESLNEVAAFYEKEVDQQCRMATSLIEPLLILVVGGLVGFIVFAMLMPIFEIGTGLH